MFKRVRWIGFGMAAGAAASLWTQRKAKDLATRYRPAGIAGAAWDRARAAVEEGRSTMRQREAELRADLDPSRAATHPASKASKASKADPATRATANPSVNGRHPH